jgi:GNAT superfamily N-acetyltransferase
MPDGATPNDKLEIVRLRLTEVPECIDIVRRSFDYFDGDADAVQNWFDARILNNPWQHALDGIGLGARDGGKLVAFRAVFAQPWWLEGQSTLIAFAAHTCIEPAYRGVGLGGRLIAASRSFADVTGSTSAGNITQKVYAKQGFVAMGGGGNDFFRLRASYVGSMKSRLGGPLGLALGGVADALSNGAEHQLRGARDFRLQPVVTACAEEFDELWSRARSGYASCLERSSRYLNWRVFDFPTHPLSLVALRDGQDRLRGYCIWHEQRYSKHVSCAVLRDLFVPHDDEEALRALVFLAIRYWRRQGMTWVNLEVASDHLTRLFTSLGYEHIPSVGNRYHVHCHRALSREVITGWFRSGLDGDYFDTRPPHRQAATRGEA